MRDRDIRDVLWRRLEDEHVGDDDTLMLDELSLLHGSTRIDVAVINGEIQGYELKSERDTLERLAGQAAIYNSVLDRVTLVVSENHAKKAQDIIPDWWGVFIATSVAGGVELENERIAQENPEPDTFSIARLLWREEAVLELEKRGCAKGIRGKPREAVYARIAETVPLADLKMLVRSTLKGRDNWRVDRRQTPNDG